MCKYYESEKICPLGAKCHFAHGKEDMRSGSDPLPANTPMIPNSKMNQQVTPMFNPMMLNNYKTVVCKYWEQGKCKYQTNCSFAHGDGEVSRGDGKAQFPTQNAMGGPFNGYDPQKDPSVEFMMKMQQLNMIASSLERLYPGDQMIEQYIKSAQQMLAANNINSAAETLQRILYSNNIGEDMKKKHEEIVQSAKKFAEAAYDMLRMGQIPEFMVPQQQAQFQNQQAGVTRPQH